MKWALAVSLCLYGPAAASAASDDPKEVRVVIETAVNSVLDVLKDKKTDSAEKKKKVIALVDPVFDFPLMGKLTLGRTNWPKLNEAQRKEFTSLFVKTIHDSYYDKLELFTDETVDLEDPVPSAEKGKYEMLTNVNSKGKRYKLFYKLYRSGKAWKIYDMEVEGISLVRTYGSQYDQVLSKSPPSELLAKMKAKALDTPEDLKAAAKAKPAAKDEPKSAPKAAPAAKKS